MTATPVQSGILRLTTPLGPDVLLAEGLEGSEGLSEPYAFQVLMRSTRSDLDASAIVGRSITVRIAIPQGPERFVHGVVRRFVQTGGRDELARYRAELVPRFWLLTLSRDRRIFQGRTVLEIVKAVLSEGEVSVEDRTTGSYAAIEYCVQYDESAFDFVSRLLENAGICYFFVFADGAHTMVLADADSAFHDCSGGAQVRFFPENQALNPIDTISVFESEHRVALRSATVSDYDYLAPSTSLAGSYESGTGSGSLYEYPAGHGSAADAPGLARLRVEAGQADAQVLRGQGYVYPFAAGTRFTLTGHFVAALNTRFVLRRVHHTARDELYSNAFEALPATVPFRPERRTPRPRAAGSETARVVGSAGEEIWTDAHGRIKVHFPWDRQGSADENSSIWIRVAQPVAGKGFGTLFLPRVGQEVVISYLNGDPDRPLVTGSVYNGEHAVPVTLPANQTQSTMRTRSSKAGEAGNEIRFEDRKDSEQLYIGARKDLLAEIGNHLTTTVAAGHEVHTLREGDRTVDVRKGGETHNVKATRILEIGGDETHRNGGAFVHEVSGDYKLTVKGSLAITVTGAIAISSDDAVSVKAGTALTNKAGTALTAEAGTNLLGKAGAKLTNQAGAQIENAAPMISSKADGMHSIEAGGILTLKGSLTKING
jgi:type VI secretion system secreted protein VgrG